MSDLHQTGIISTLHRYHTSSTEHLENELIQLTSSRPTTLILPMLYSELHGDGLKSIVKELMNIKYLHQVIVTLGNTDRKEFQEVLVFFNALPQKVKIIWNTGKRIRELCRLMKKNNVDIGPDGKGRAIWMAIGYLLAEKGSYMVAFHDCDITNYSRELLARLCYPIANPNLNYEFSKGYYSRVSDRIYGRVTRLFITPLIRSMEKIIGYVPILVYLDSFRYPLAGEFSMTVELARISRINGNWGFDLGILAEVFRKCSPTRICQVNLMDSYEHKHQPLSQDNPESGLFKMSIDISRVFFRALSSEGVVFSDSMIKTLMATYLRTAQDTIKKYNDDATINNLPFDRHQETIAIETFAKGLFIGGNSFLEDPLGYPEIPNWTSVTAVIPESLEMLKNAVEEDNC